MVLAAAEQRPAGDAFGNPPDLAGRTVRPSILYGCPQFETAEAEAVLGGKLHIYTQGYNAYGEFTRLEQDRAVAFTFNGDAEPPALITVLIEKQGEGCGMTFTVSGDWSEQDHPGFNAFLERTWGRVLDNLKAVLESKQGTQGEK